MQTVLNPSVFITTSYDEMKSFISEGGNFNLNTDNSILFSNDTSKYLHSLEHSFNYSSKKNVQLVLKFVDVDSNLENFLFSQTLFSKIVRDSVDSFIKDLKDKRTNIDQIYSEIGPELLSEFKIYVCYGTTNDLSDWSDPFQCTLVESDIELNNNLKIYKFTFYPDTSPLLRPSLKPNTDDPNYSNSFRFGDRTLVKKEELKFKDLASLDISDLLFANLDLVLHKLTRKYLASLLNVKEEDIIIILPGISQYLYKYISKNYATKISDEDAVGLTINIAPPTILQLAYKNLFNINCSFYGKDPRRDGDKFERLAVAIREAVIPPEAKSAGMPQPDFVAEHQISKKQNTTMTVGMVAAKHNEFDLTNPKIIDLWKPLNDLFQGYNSLYNEGHTSLDLDLLVESNIKILNIFKNYDIITKDAEKCYIFGEKQMIRDYIYCTTPNMLIDDLLDYESPLKFPEYKNTGSIATYSDYLSLQDFIKIKNILQESPNNYRADILRLFKKSGTSAFKEKISFDELAIDPVSRTKSQSLNEISDLNSKVQIPTFLSNFKNSNVLSYSVQNQESAYLQSLRVGVVNERYNLSNFVTRQSDILEAIGITEDQVNGVKEALSKKLGDHKLQDFNIGIESDSSEINNIFKNFEPPTNYWFDENVPFINLYRERFNKLSISNNKPLSKFLDVISNFSAYAKYDKSKAAQPFVTTNLDNMTYLGVLFAEQIRETLPQYKNSAITIGQLMAAISISNVGSNSTQAIPSPTGPQQGSITGKIYNEMLKQSFKLNIKTLPFFNLSNNFAIGRPCFFYSKATKIKTNNNTFNTDNKFDVFSGQYVIQAFKHKISPTECHSEFTLIKSFDFKELDFSKEQQESKNK